MKNSEDSCKTMLNSFRVCDLRKLLQAFNKNIAGRKFELKEYALYLLRVKPVGFDYQAYEAKIVDLYWKTPQSNKLRKMYIKKEKMMSASMQQSRSLKMEQNPPHNLQQSTNIPQVLVPQVLPQTPKGVIIKSFYRSTNTYQPVDHRHAVPFNHKANAVATNHILTRDKINATNFTPNIRLLANVKIIKLPFYENMAEIIKLSCLVGHGRCSIPNIHGGNN